MRQSVPLSWIEQAEAAQVLNSALFCRLPQPASRRPPLAALMDRASRLGADIADQLLSLSPLLQPQPVPVRASDRRFVRRGADYDDFSRCC